MASSVTSLYIELAQASERIDTEVLKVENAGSQFESINRELASELIGALKENQDAQKLTKILNTLRKCHRENEKLLKDLEEKTVRAKDVKSRKASVERKEVGLKRSVQQSETRNTLLTANSKATRAPTSIPCAKSTVDKQPVVSTMRSSRRGQRGTLMDLPSAPSPAVSRSTTASRNRTTPKSVSRDTLGTLSGSSAKRTTTTITSSGNKTRSKKSTV